MKLFIRTVHIVLLLVLAGPSLLHAQPAATPLVLNYDVNTYKAENQNWSVDVRDDGMVFIGNNEGLLVTDGVHWDLLQIPGHSVVRSVAVSDTNRIYAGTFEEFGYFLEDEKGDLSYHSLSDQLLPDVLHNDEFWRIIPVGEKVYFQSFAAIYVYDGESVRPLELPGSVVLLQKVHHRLFIDVVDIGLHEIINDRVVPLTGMDLLKGDEVKVVLPWGKDRLLLGAARGGLYLYDGQKATPWTIGQAENIRNAEINNGLFLDNRYFIGTIVDGVYILDTDGRMRNHLHTGNVLQNNTILSMAADNRGNVWLGLDRGIDQVINSPSLSFYLDPASQLGTVFDAAEFNGDLWLGTNLGLIRMSGGITLPGEPELIPGAQGQVWDLFPVNHEMLIGHNAGTYKIGKGNKLTEVSPVNGGFDMQLYDNGDEQVLIQSSYNTINIYRKKDDRWQFSHAVKNLTEPFTKFEIDPYGNIWAAHLHRNIFRIKLNETLDSIVEIRTLGIAEGFPHDGQISVSKIDNRVVFPTGEKIYTYDDLIDTIIPYERLNKTVGPFAAATHVISAGERRYWFIRGQRIGSFRINGNNIDSLFTYNLAMQGLHLGKTFPRIVPLDSERSLICLDKGFIIYREQEPTVSGQPEPAFIRQIIAEGSQKMVKLSLHTHRDPVNIPWSCRNITFTYSTLPHYKKPVYRTKLDGLEEQWSTWKEPSEISYERLPAGKYTFNLQAVNIHGTPGPVSAYPFIIRPPWYLSVLAILVYVVIFGMSVVMIRIAFLKKLKLHALRLEEEKQEKIRQQQLQSEQEFIRLKNELLQKDLDFKNNQLADYTMNVIRKNEVLMKVKDELEKQKAELTDRYPNYLYDRLMKLLDSSISSEDEWKVFEYHFDQTHENFFRRLKKQYPELTPGDLKLCAYLRMNLSSKELAPLLNINHKSVEVHRSRLRKKLRLTPDENLVEFLLEY